MSEHVWSQEQIAAYLAGGLGAVEAERLEVHARECSECAAALERSRRLDSRLGSLFAIGRPGPELEDRALLALRLSRDRTPAREGWQKRLLIAAGITVFVTSVGFVGSRADRFPTPWNVRGWSFAKGFAISSETDETAIHKQLTGGLPYNSELTNEGLGLQSDLGATEISKLYKPNVFALPDYANFEKMNRGEGLGTRLDGVQFGDGSTRRIEIDGIRPPMPTNGLMWYDAANSNWNANANTYGLGFDSFSRPSGTTNGRVDRRGTNTPGTDKIDGNNVTQDRVVLNQLYVNPYYPNPANSLGQAETRPSNPSDTTVTFGVPVQKPVAVNVGTSETPKTAKTDLPTTGLPVVPLPGTLQPAPTPNPDPGVRNNVVIRSGEIEFEVESFDSAAATITKLVMGIKGAFIATVNSEKLANGKVKGAITVRVPPEQLDGLLLDLRKELTKGGELKGSRIGSQDITKQYTDLESRLKAARTMEQRLLQIIKEGKGEIKQLLDAEKELGIWRTKIEETEGELRYYSNLVALSTLTITLTEKEIRAAATMTESERIQAGVEVEDVDKVYQQILAAVVEAKGRVTKSEVKQLSAGQFNATLNFEVAPEAAGPLRDRLRQLGRVARLEIDRVQQPEGTVTKNAKVQRGDTLFFVQLYNLANIAPREVAVVQVAVPDVPTAYQTLRDAVAKTTGRVLIAQLNEQDQKNVAAQFDFEVRRTDEAIIRTAVDTLGEVVARQVTRAPESDNVTDAKVMYRTMLIAKDQLKPRERTTLTLEVADVDQTVVVFGVHASEMKGRQVDAQFTHDRSGRLTAKLLYEVPLLAASGLVERFKASGAVLFFQSSRDPQAPEGKYATTRLEVTLTNSERIVGEDDGLWPQVRRGLSHSASALLKSISWMVFGLCVVLPWAVIGYGCYKVLRWLIRSKSATVAATPPPAT